VLAVAREFFRVADCVLLLNVGGAAAVLEVINRAPAHVLVLYAAKIYPDVRELMNKKRAGVQVFVIVKLLPAVSARPRLITFGGQRVRRRP
jgi:hypothetical protein